MCFNIQGHEHVSYLFALKLVFRSAHNFLYMYTVIGIYNNEHTTSHTLYIYTQSVYYIQQIAHVIQLQMNTYIQWNLTVKTTRTSVKWF